MKRNEALNMDTSFWVGKDFRTGYWCIFGDNSCYRYYFAREKSNAEREAKRMNELLVPQDA